MGLFVSRLKLRAAAGSMHQFCPRVKMIFPVAVDEPAVEASTAFLYLQTARDVLGRRFASSLARQLASKFRAPKREQMVRVARISAMADAHGGDEEFHEFITRVVKALLQEAGCPTNDPETLRECFTYFQEAVGPMKEHLMGIKNQNTWVLRRAA